jgi:hypothetical protein
MAKDDKEFNPDEKEKPIRALDADDIAFLKNYGLGPYAASIKKTEGDIADVLKRVNDLCGIKESDTGLAAPSRWDLVSDKQMMQEEQPLQARTAPRPWCRPRESSWHCTPEVADKHSPRPCLWTALCTPCVVHYSVPGCMLYVHNLPKTNRDVCSSH